MPSLRFMKSVQAQLKNWGDFGAFQYVGDSAPLSGTSGYGVNICGPGSRYLNTLTGVVYVNEGTAANPYWTPISLVQRSLLSWFSDFRDGVGSPLADTNVTLTLAGSGLRVYGLGVANADSGFTIAQILGGAEGSLVASATATNLAAIGHGGATVALKPSVNGPLVIDANITNLTALTLRRAFIGFVGTSADGLVSPVTGAVVTITNVQTDVAGMMFDVGLTAATEWFATHNKANDTPTLATSAAQVDTGVAVAAAGTYQRLRVEVDAAGNVTMFINKIQVSTFALGLTPATALAAVLLIASTSAATKTLNVKEVQIWANR